MNEDILDDLQQLTYSQNALLHRLVDLGLLESIVLNELLDRLVDDRLEKARSYQSFAAQLDVADSTHQPHIISRCYYAMYHAARAVVLHYRGADLDDHDRLPTILGQILGARYGELLGNWRKVRNRVDYSPYRPIDLPQLAGSALQEGSEMLNVCGGFVRSRWENP